MRQLIADKVAPKNRDEKEIVGYRDVLNLIHESHDYIPLKPAYILQLHRDLLMPAGLILGGRFKNAPNYINEMRAEGTG